MEPGQHAVKLAEYMKPGRIVLKDSNKIFTPRQRDVLQCICDGNAVDTEIANKLNMGKRAVTSALFGRDGGSKSAQGIVPIIEEKTGKRVSRHGIPYHLIKHGLASIEND